MREEESPIHPVIPNQQVWFLQIIKRFHFGHLADANLFWNRLIKGSPQLAVMFNIN